MSIKQSGDDTISVVSVVVVTVTCRVDIDRIVDVATIGGKQSLTISFTVVFNPILQISLSDKY